MDRGFNVAHQKVSIDVDLAEKVIRGTTEITIVPSDLLVRQFRFDCRQAQVKSVLINDKKASFTHNDASGYEAFSASRTVSSVHQHHLYRKYIDHAHKEVLEGELEVNLPRGVKVSYQDTSRETGPSAEEDAVGVYTPLIVTINFVVKDPKTGVTFVGGHGSRLKRSFWHAYTTHAPIGAATSHWLPCVDGLWSRCTWQFEISVPRTVGSLMKNKQQEEEEEVDATEADEDDMEVDGTGDGTADGANTASARSGAETEGATNETSAGSPEADADVDMDKKEDEEEEEEEEENMDAEIEVVGNGALAQEVSISISYSRVCLSPTSI